LIDLYAGYAATDLTFVDKRQGAALEAGTDACGQRGRAECPSNPKGVKVLDPFAGGRSECLRVTKAEAD